EADKVSIKTAAPRLKAFYSAKEFGSSEAEMLSTMGEAWSDFRRENPKTPLTADGFEKFAESYGGLRIRSQPPKATIHVDEKAWTDPTNTEGGARVGERAIKLSKDNYEDETGTAVVKQGQWTTF